MSCHAKSEPHVHAAGVVLNRGVEALLGFGETAIVVELRAISALRIPGCCHSEMFSRPLSSG